MQISFENTFDHWIAFQIFRTEQLKPPLARYARKKIFKIIFWLVIFIAIVNIIGFDRETFDPISFCIPLLIPFIVFIWLLWRKPFPRNAVMTQLKIAHEADFEKISDKRMTWDITPAGLDFYQHHKQGRYQWDSVESITLCPQYAIVHFGFIDHTYLPRQAVNEAEYQSFCQYLLSTYKAHAAAQGKPANIIQSNWTIDMNEVEWQSRPCSGKKIFMSLVWGLIFLLVFCLFFGLIILAVVAVSVSLESRTSINTDSIGMVFVSIWLFGSLLMGILGIILGLKEKLPGTRMAEPKPLQAPAPQSE